MINEAVRERLGRWRSADILMRSVDFQAVVDMQRAVLWDEIGHHLGTAARPLKAAGPCALSNAFGADGTWPKPAGLFVRPHIVRTDVKRQRVPTHHLVAWQAKANRTGAERVLELDHMEL